MKYDRDKIHYVAGFLDRYRRALREERLDRQGRLAGVPAAENGWAGEQNRSLLRKIEQMAVAEDALMILYLELDALERLEF